MAQILITKINAGAQGTVSYNGKPYPELDIDFSKKIGLLKYSAWLWNVKVGDKLIIPYKMLESIKEASKGVFEFELCHPKYANKHYYSDVRPYEIIEWKSETRVVLREMDTADYGPMGEYCDTYISNPNYPTFEVREHKNGGLYDAGTNSCPYILSDEPYYRRDPSF